MGSIKPPYIDASISDALLIDYLDELPDDVAVCQPDGNILYVNSAWRNFAQQNGYEGPEFVGQNYFAACEICEGAERSQAEAVYTGLKDLSEGNSKFFQFVYPCHSPSEKRWFKLTATRAGGHMMVHHQPIVLKNSNVSSEAKMIPDYMLAQHDAQLAHDVKTSLNGVLGYIQLSKMILDNQSDCEAASDKLDDAEKAGWHITRYLDGLMRRSKLLSDEELHEDNVADVAKVIDDCFSTLKPTAPDIRVQIDCQLPSNVLLMADPDAIHRIVLNVISNAMKYNKSDGWVEISATQNRSGGIVLSVEDGGFGIPEETLPYIFDPFNRDDSHNKIIKGTGLGLTNVKELMDAFDAKINVSSKVDEGSRFSLTFPSWRTIQTGQTVVGKPLDN